MTDVTITYEPDNSIRRGRRGMVDEIYADLRRNGWLTLQLFKRDFFALYKQSFVGFFWAMLMPLISVGTFVALNRSGILSVGSISVPYPVFAVFGISLWQLFSTGLIASTNSLVKVGPMITKINFSKKSLVIASVGQSLVSFAVQLVLLVVLLVSFRVMPTAGIMLLPVLILPIVLLTLGLGFALALLNAIARDIGNVLAVLLNFFMFLTPVLYAKPASGVLASATKYNPLYFMISAPRDLVFGGSTPELKGFLVSASGSLVLFLLALVMFHLTETRVAERI